MKKAYYSDRNYEDIETNTYINGDAEKRKQISLETNRRRRDMALRVKMQLEREEERRQQVLRERKEKQEALNNKLRFRRKKPEIIKPTKTDNIDKILEMIRANDDRQKLSKNRAWEDGDHSQRETCESPMGRYSGMNHSMSVNGHNNKFIPVSTNMRLHEWENDFRRSREVESAKEFARKIEDEVTTTIKNGSQHGHEQNHDHTPQNTTFTNQQSTYRKDLLSELLGTTEKDDEPYNINPSSHSNSSYASNTAPIPMNYPTQTQEVIIHDQLDTNSLTEQDSLDEQDNESKPTAPILPPEIKGILKKTNSISSRLDSNSDLSISNLRDSVDIAKNRNASQGIPRSSSYSTGLSRLTYNNGDDLGSECSLATTTTMNDERKAVRFADEPPRIRAVSAVNLVNAVNGNGHRTTQNTRINTTMTRNNQQAPTGATKNKKLNGVVATSMIPQNNNSVPSSTSLKPPLHPTPSTISTTQPNSTISLNNNHHSYMVNPSNNSSFLAAFKKQQQQQNGQPTSHSPVKPPKKITSNVLEKEIGALVRKRTPSPVPNSHNNQIISHPPQPPLPHTLFNNLDKTPTEAEIDQLWAEVRETLSRNSNHSNNVSPKLSPTHQLLHGQPNIKADSLISSCSSRGTIQGGYKQGGGLKSASEEGSLRSVPVWRSNIPRKGPPSGAGSIASSNGTIRQSPVPFHVKHYNPVRPTSSTSGFTNSGVNGSNLVDKPLADKVVVHTCKGTPLTVNQYPLSVISPMRPTSNAARNNKEKISESLEEFLEMESACSSSRANSKANQNSHNTTPNSSLVNYNNNNQSNPSRVFLHRPISQYRPILRSPNNLPNQIARPVIANHNYSSNISNMSHQPQYRNSRNFGSSGRGVSENNNNNNNNNNSNENSHRSQLSMEEEKLKASLDRLNERLKCGSTR